MDRRWSIPNGRNCRTVNPDSCIASVRITNDNCLNRLRMSVGPLRWIENYEPRNNLFGARIPVALVRSLVPMQIDESKSIGTFSIRHCDASLREHAEQILTDLTNNESSRRFVWKPVKKNKLRTVFRVESSAGVVFVKQHVATGLRRRIKSFLFGDPTRSEYDASQFAQERGVPCVNVFATAEQNFDGRDSVILLSHAVENARSLSEEFAHIDGLGACVDYRSLAASVAQLLATAHDETFLHADDHPGNILVQRIGDDRPKCLYVDLQGSRCGRELSLDDAAFSLASLGQWFADRTPRSVRLAVVKQYIQLRGWPTSRTFLSSFLSRIHTASLRRRRTLYRKRDKRIGRNNAHFARVPLDDGWCAWITRRFRNQSELTGVHPPQWHESNLAGQLRSSFGLNANAPESNSVTDGPDDSTWFTSNLRESWSWRFFGSPAKRRYVMACMAMNRDIPTALPLGCAEQRSGWGTGCSKHIVERPPQCVPILTLLRTLPPAPRRRLLERIGRHLGKTFDRGLVITNISPNCLEATCLDGEDVPIWVRIEGRSLGRPVSKPVQNWILGRLASEAVRIEAASVVEMTRVLRACVRSSFPSSHWKSVWRENRELVNLSTDPSDSRPSTQ